MLPCVTPDFKFEFTGQNVHSLLGFSNTPGNVVLSHVQSPRSIEPAGDIDRAGHFTQRSSSKYKFSPHTLIHAKTGVKVFNKLVPLDALNEMLCGPLPGRPWIPRSLNNVIPFLLVLVTVAPNGLAPSPSIASTSTSFANLPRTTDPYQSNTSTFG